MNNSSTGGYALPTSTQGLPKGLTLMQFIQTVFVGVTGLPGPFVRPKWQVNPPKQPDIGVNWMAIGVATSKPDANAYLAVNPDGSNLMQRNEQLTIPCSVYGPDAFDTISLIRDGFQIPQNREALLQAKMGFVETTTARHIPDFVNERWIDRFEMEVVLNREVLRSYPILTFLSASGTVYAATGEEAFLVDWEI